MEATLSEEGNASPVRRSIRVMERERSASAIEATLSSTFSQLYSSWLFGNVVAVVIVGMLTGGLVLFGYFQAGVAELYRIDVSAMWLIVGLLFGFGVVHLRRLRTSPRLSVLRLSPCKTERQTTLSAKKAPQRG